MFVSLNPRFDGAFLNSIQGTPTGVDVGLNPRFDGAFLNLKFQYVKEYLNKVLIPDLMGLF